MRRQVQPVCTPNALVCGTTLRSVVVPGMEFPIVYPQLTVEQVQLLYSRMACEADIQLRAPTAPT